MSPTPKRRRTRRLSHLTMAKAMARLLRGPVQAKDLVDVTGLSPDTIHKLFHSLEVEGAIRPAGKAPDSRGRLRVQMFELAL